MVEIARIKEGVMLYAQRHMMPLLDSKGQFMLGVGLGMISGRVEAMMASLANNELVKTLGIIRDGQVDWETLYVAAVDQMKRQGKLVWDIPLIGRLTFGEEDLRDLHMCIMQGGGAQ